MGQTTKAAKEKAASQLLVQLQQNHETVEDVKSQVSPSDKLLVPKKASILQGSSQSSAVTSPSPTPSSSDESSEKRVIGNSLFNNKKKSDITFIVGRPGDKTQKIYGHKLIIGLGSPVLDNLFDTDWKAMKEVKVHCNPSAFITLFKFLYDQELVFEKDLLTEVLLLQNEYKVVGFTKKLLDNLTEDVMKKTHLVTP